MKINDKMLRNISVSLIFSTYKIGYCRQVVCLVGDSRLWFSNLFRRGLFHVSVLWERRH